MSSATQSLVFNAVPLLVLAAAYLGATALLLPRLWRAREQAQAPDVALAVIFPCVGAAAAAWGVFVLLSGSPIAGHVWSAFPAIVVALVPALVVLASWRDPDRLLASARTSRAEEEASARGRELQSLGDAAAALARARDAEEVARVLAGEVRSLLGVEVAGLALVDDDGRRARGVLLYGPQGEADWYRGMEYDLEHEPSGVASAVFDAAPVTVYDMEAAPDVQRRISDAIGARSAAFVPLIAADRVLAVAFAVATSERRSFTNEELRVLRTLAGEAAQALQRAHAAAALEAALTRERLVGEIARRLRSELDVASVTRVAVAETAAALGLARAYIRLAADGGAVLAAEWAAPGLPPLADDPDGLPAGALGEREPRTLAVADVAAEGAPGALGLAGTRALLAVPLQVFDRLIGEFALHRGEPHAWTEGEVALAEGVAREVAVAVHAARLLDENRRRLERQAALVEAAGVVAGELEPETVLQRLVEEVTELLDADAADCYLLDAERGVLRLAAVHGLDPGSVAREFPADRGLAGRALAEGRPVLSNDYRSVAPALEGDPYPDFAHAVAAPMSWSGAVRGTLAVASRAGGRRFTEGDLGVLEAFAQLASLALRNAQLLRENRERIDRQRRLLHAAQVMTSELEPETVLERVVEHVSELVGGDGAQCWLLDPGRGRVRLAAVHGPGAEALGVELPAPASLPAGLDAPRPPVATGEQQPPFALPDDPYATAILAPIGWSGEGRGLVVVGSCDAGRTFTEADQAALDTYAGLASLALRNAQAFEERERRARVERGFARIAAALGETLSLPETLAAVAQAASDSFGGDFAAVLMPADGGLRLAGGHALPAALAEALGDGLPAAAEVLSGAAREGRVVAAPDAAADSRFGEEWHRLAGTAGFASLLAIPVARPEDAGGGLVVVFVRGRRVFADDDLELARQLASAARGALERSELYERERAARSLAQELARTGTLLAAELEPAAVLDEAAEQALPLLGVDACTIRILDGDELVLEAAAGAGVGAPVGGRVPSTARLSGDVVQTRAPLALEDAGADPRAADSEPVLADGFRGYLAVPLLGADASFTGVLAVYTRTSRRWREEEVEALGALAANAGAAVSTAELYQRVALEKQQSDAILANIADGIVAVDREGRVVLWNAAAERITRVPAEDALGRTPAQVLQRDLESSVGASGERLVSIQRGPEELWLSISEAVMRDPAGAVAGRIYAFRDISAERVLEQMKSDFVSTVSAQLRTPLTSIYGFAETLLRQDVLFREEERRTFLGYIASESERLTSIVDALLNVARLDTGDLQVQLAATDVADVVAEVVAAVDGGNGHRFVVDVPGRPVDAHADRDKLRQILHNLVDNAVKFSPDGGTVTIGARRKGETVELRVTDEGIGIPAAAHEHIFRKFFRADPTGRGGTGLGLFIVQGLVAAMGGRIWVDSEEGKGSSFAVELPAAAGSDD